MTGIELSLLLFVIGIFTIVVVLMIQSERKRRVRKRNRAVELGFMPIEAIPSSIQDRISWLHSHHPNQKLEIRDLAIRKRTDYTLFLLDLYDTGGDETSSIQADMILLISPQLSLPRFTLIPRISQSGVLAEWVNRALEALISRQGDKLIELQDGHFNRSFMLFGEDQRIVSDFFDRTSFLSTHLNQYVTIEAGGDAFTFGRLSFPSQAQHPGSELNEDLRLVERWFQLFRKASD
jgi:hypothetical protein